MIYTLGIGARPISATVFARAALVIGNSIFIANKEAPTSTVPVGPTGLLKRLADATHDHC